MLTDPVFEYPRSDGRSVTGGYVYRGSVFSEFLGYYICADYSSGNFWMINSTDQSDFTKFSLQSRISSFGESESGELYAAQLNSGTIYRVFDGSICQDELTITTHDTTSYSAQELITSDISVTGTQDIEYNSPELRLNSPFSVEEFGLFRSTTRTCEEVILAEKF